MPLHSLLRRNLFVLTGSAALKALAQASWAANDLDLFGVLNDDTVTAVTEVLQELKKVNLLKEVTVSSSLDRNAGALSEGTKSRQATTLVHEPALFKQLAKKVWGLQLQPVVIDSSYSKVSSCRLRAFELCYCVVAH